MFLNMLIAIMGDTFDKVTESKEQSALVEKIRILADYVYVVRRESLARGTLSRFVFAIRPKAMGADESATWEGTTTIIQKSIEANVQQSTKIIGQKVFNLQEDIADGNKKISLLEERMAEINGSNMRQQGMLE